MLRRMLVPARRLRASARIEDCWCTSEVPRRLYGLYRSMLEG